MEAQPTPHQPEFSWRRAPELLADRLGTTPVALLAGLVMVVAAAFGAWWAMRPPPPPPAEDSLPRIASIEIVSATTTVPAPGPLVVHVDGAVLVPGVHEVREGGRVIDAIEAAGGLSPDADSTRLNLALLVGDQQRIWVPRQGEEEPSVVLPSGAFDPSTDGSGTGRDDLVDINRADTNKLESLPGIGPSLAAAIVEHRDREGPFRSVDDLLDVAGIGPAKLDQLRPRARI